MRHLRSLLIIGEKPRATTMADDDIENLKKARRALVQARQQQAKTILNTQDATTAKAFADIQEGIEAIDRAIEELQDEEDEDEDE
jgi:DNA-binding ferritin-like protein